MATQVPGGRHIAGHGLQDFRTPQGMWPGRIPKEQTKHIIEIVRSLNAIGAA